MGSSQTLTAETLGNLDGSITTVVGLGEKSDGAGACDATHPTGVICDAIDKELST